MFKVNWEKTSATHILPEGLVDKMVQLAYPDKKLISCELIAGGCANINFKVHLEPDQKPYILRIYLRDKEAAYIEQKIAELLKATVPVPTTYYIGEYEEYRFAITEFMPGISLRDLLLGDEPYDLRDIMYKVGVVLANITKHKLDKSGFFDKELCITNELSDDFALKFSRECCSHPNVVKVLGSKVIDEVSLCFEKYHNMFPSSAEKCLVHADFDPANILVDKINGAWVVTGVLDWEFAFANSVLHDVANMLRYSHKMPYDFQEGFLRGLHSAGIIMPENWSITINILNLLSVIDCIKRVDPKTNPIRCNDIKELITHILSDLAGVV